MSDALAVFVPLFAFMLLPVWIPIIAVTIGWVGDQLGGRGHDEVVARFAPQPGGPARGGRPPAGGGGPRGGAPPVRRCQGALARPPCGR